MTNKQPDVIRIYLTPCFRVVKYNIISQLLKKGITNLQSVLPSGIKFRPVYIVAWSGVVGLVASKTLSRVEATPHFGSQCTEVRVKPLSLADEPRATSLTGYSRSWRSWHPRVVDDAREVLPRPVYSAHRPSVSWPLKIFSCQVALWVMQ